MKIAIACLIIFKVGSDYQDLERLKAPKTLHGESPFFKGGKLTYMC